MFEPTGTLEDIVPDARAHFEELLELADELGLDPVIRSAGRTCAMQNALHAAGPGTTRAVGCRSWHVLGRAIDLDLHPSSCEHYTRLGEAWEAMGGTWGGRWLAFGACGDAGHFQWSGGVAAVPAAVCPDEGDCETVRQGYLASEFAARAGVGTFLFGAFVAGAFSVWLWRRGRRWRS